MSNNTALVLIAFMVTVLIIVVGLLDGLSDPRVKAMRDYTFGLPSNEQKLACANAIFGKDAQ